MARVQGLDKLNRKVARMPAAAKTEIKRGLDTGADKLVAMAKALAPVADGDVKASIRKEPGAHELSVVVRAGGPPGSPAEHAVFVEFGTDDTEAQPFLMPSFRALKRSIRSSIAYRIVKAAKAVANG
ncbi:hypothetical protein ASD04_00120 [Devosia sp. Root436]|uniref:HK97-gp10 family putative phage morphogenesis protein n=1 Tax=Devosia sp. Root436 TaxID=1736537 RepID=UPI0006F6EABD|nr:HK97-gp10 family putative phage morphogenesis protein [Devosia sp. Root436]KQX42415.1 hypothetical protein ASD04_00120 [Devosia sp. Root436]